MRWVEYFYNIATKLKINPKINVLKLVRLLLVKIKKLYLLWIQLISRGINDWDEEKDRKVLTVLNTLNEMLFIVRRIGVSTEGCTMSNCGIPCVIIREVIIWDYIFVMRELEEKSQKWVDSNVIMFEEAG